jgi:hypothetical protein
LQFSFAVGEALRPDNLDSWADLKITQQLKASGVMEKDQGEEWRVGI